MLRIAITFCLLHAENLRFPWGGSVSPRSFGGAASTTIWGTATIMRTDATEIKASRAGATRLAATLKTKR